MESEERIIFRRKNEHLITPINPALIILRGLVTNESRIILSRTKKFVINSSTNAVLQIIMMVAGLITPRLILRYYGSEINGVISSITQFIAYFNLVEAGISGAAVYALYRPLAENDYTAINGILSAAKKFYLQAGWVLRH